MAVRAGLFLLKASGWYQGYWQHWRGPIFDEAQAQGIHILPVHYYSPIPDISKLVLDDTEAKFPIIDEQALDRSFENWKSIVGPVAGKFREISLRSEIVDGLFSYTGAPYSPGDAELLYGWILSRKPKRIIEIGCGYTTLLISEAIGDAKLKDGDYNCEMQCIEPYPPEYLDPLPSHVTEIISKPLQEVDPTVFETLEENDLLFIDSTHVLACGSDVVYEYLGLLPRLNAGVVVHIHDIFLPYDYPKSWMQKSRFFWNEQYILACALRSGNRYTPLFPMHQLYQERQKQMEDFVPNLHLNPPGPASFWIQVAKQHQ